MKNKLTIIPPDKKSTKSTTLAVVNSKHPDFEHARKIQAHVKSNLIQAAGFMVLWGMELFRLKKVYGIKRGGNRKGDQTQNGLALIGTWGDIVKAELGISDETANTYIELFKKGKSRCKILQDMEETLMTTMLGDLPEDQQNKIFAAVQKLTDGETAKSLMQQWGIAKGNPSANLQKDRSKGGHSTKKKLKPEEEAQERFEALLKLMTGTRLDGGVIEWAKLLNHLPLEHTPDMPDGHVSLVEYREELTHWLEAVEIAIKRQAKAQHKTFTKLKSSDEHADILDS